MSDIRVAAYGSWSSPITSDMIVASSIGLGEIMLDGADVYWLESRPQEGGRSVLVRRSPDGNTADLTPPVAADGGPVFSVRTRVHEYGGGAYLVHAGVIYFSNDADQRLYSQLPGAAPVAITPEPAVSRGLRYADGVMDARRQPDDLGPRGSHHERSREPVNTLVEIPLDSAQPQRVLQSGRDFYAAPRLSPDGARLAWLEWNHPLMPWIGCELWVGEITADGSISGARRIAGGDDESIFQPEWSPDGSLYFVSDRAQDGVAGRWWNLFRVAGDALAPSSATQSVWPLAAEFGRPQWNFRMSTYAFDAQHRLICSYIEQGVHRLGMVDLDTLTDDLDPDALPGHLLGARNGRTCLFPRRRADRTAGNCRARPRIGAYDGAAAVRPPRMSTPIAAICRSRSR